MKYCSDFETGNSARCHNNVCARVHYDSLQNCVEAAAAHRETSMASRVHGRAATAMGLDDVRSLIVGNAITDVDSLTCTFTVGENVIHLDTEITCAGGCCKSEVALLECRDGIVVDVRLQIDAYGVSLVFTADRDYCFARIDTVDEVETCDLVNAFAITAYE